MAKRKTKPTKPVVKSRTNATLDEDIQLLVEKHSGRTRVTTRDPSGKQKILTIMFGARRAPSHQLDVTDFGTPEDPTSRDQRLHADRVRAHDARRKEIEEALTKALREQKERLTGETDVKAPAVIAAPPVDPDEVWSKRSVTALLAQILGADDCALGADSVKVNTEKGKNEIFLTQGDRTVKLNISFPRKPKK